MWRNGLHITVRLMQLSKRLLVWSLLVPTGPRLVSLTKNIFERMDKQAERFGQPVAALLGSIEAQIQLGLPSIGGKDSMSGTFEELTVPPTLVAFGVTTADSRTVLSPEFKAAGENIY